MGLRRKLLSLQYLLRTLRSVPPSPLSNKTPAVMLVAAGVCVESLMAESLSVLKTVLKAIRCFWFERRML